MTMQPWMSFHEINLIESAMLAQDKKHLQVLEWGCGGSTSYFPEFLQKHGIDCHWVSIEHNREWYEKVSRELADRKNIEIHWFEAEGERQELSDEMMQDYINFPATLDTRFDIVIVDGRKRQACLKQATKLLSEDGAVFLHDALRPRYHDGFRFFPDGRFISLKLWQGTVRPVGLWRRISNGLNYLYYRYIVKKLYRIYRDRLEKKNIPFDYQASRW